ncbi:PE family protein, partial [Mycobacterium szulgai]|uniref:PE family protein n=1 Tax=Mycobacterium szulgai TaxID=1787 RepID=UPI0021F259A2
MSFVFATPEAVTAAAGDLANIGSALNAANTAAGLSTTSVPAAGADEVSAAIAALFGSHGQEYQALSARAAALHDRFVQTLQANAGSYAGAEAVNASPLQTIEQDILGVINAPTQTLLGRPLIGNGADATTPGGNGGDGGYLYGNGGAGGAGGTGQNGGHGGNAGLWGNGGTGGNRGTWADRG